ncbi:hypothetical protein ACEPPN_001000 [Leptodophora sp. 'Broadleaf-Isolate-01']
MGLIKTAMMTGGGIYAVKQLAKTAERRHDNNNNNNNSQGSRDPGYPSQQGYWGPPGGPQGPPPPRPYYQDQREWSSYNQTDERYPPRGPYGPSDSYDQKRAYREEDYQYQPRDRMAGQPPSYYPDQQQQQQQGYATGPPQEDGSRGGVNPAGLAGMALDFVGSGNRSGGNGKQLEKGTQLVSEFFGK